MCSHFSKQCKEGRPLWTSQVWFIQMVHLLGLSCSITIHTTPQSSSDERTTSTIKINDSLCLLIVRKVLENQGVRRDSAEIIMSAWREGTKQCYHIYIKKWIKHCGEQSTDPSCPTVDELIVFLTKLFHVGRVCMFQLLESSMKSCRHTFSSRQHISWYTAFGKDISKGSF